MLVFSYSIGNLLFFSLATVGLTAILVHGKIFESFRNSLAERVDIIQRRRERLGLRPTFNFVEFLNSILTCFQCCGFWSGLFCGSPIILIGEWGSVRGVLLLIFTWFCCGLVGSLLAHLYFWFMEVTVALTKLMQALNPNFHGHHHEHNHEAEHSFEEPQDEIVDHE
ncbi:MAG: hypothetical protein ACRC2T_06170 [Thermoguttaceae bacterium]